MKRASGIIVVCGLWMASCGGAPDTAVKNKTFYDWSVGSGAQAGSAGFEQPYPRLDLAEGPTHPGFMGVAVVRGGVRMSRPREWKIREASNDPGRSFIQYTSPKAYSFAIYERPESPREPWREVLNRYEEDVTNVGAKVVGRRVPVSTSVGQGRAYSIERSVEASKKPFTSRSREIVVRGEHRILMVQIVHQAENLSAVDAELLHVINSLEVL